MLVQKILKLNFFILTLFGLLVIIISFYFFNKISHDFYLVLNQNEINRNERICNPIISNFKPFIVNIENELYPKSISLSRNQSIDFNCLNSNNKTKVILLWNTFFESADYGFGLGNKDPFIKNKCPVTNCEITNDKQKFNESDLVITHMRNDIEILKYPRRFNQKWTFFLAESPVHSADFTKYNGFFNLTSTYKIDSDFPGFYETGSNIHWELNGTFNINFDFYKNKTNFAVAVISNCETQSRRKNYIEILRKYINVDVFGNCGKTCPIFYKNSNIKGDCKEILSKEYKFYFAFENSICNDYITEKFFDILKYNVIPVVMGGGKYDYYVIYLVFFINLLIFLKLPYFRFQNLVLLTCWITNHKRN